MSNANKDVEPETKIDKSACVVACDYSKEKWGLDIINY